LWGTFWIFLKEKRGKGLKEQGKNGKNDKKAGEKAKKGRVYGEKRLPPGRAWREHGESMAPK
jgi:hypothetical protein